MLLQLHDPAFEPAVTSLSDLFALAWSELVTATGDLHHPWRLPSLGTVFENAPQQRIVVLREADAERCELTAHTDLRSPKIVQLRQNPRVSWLCYHPISRVQLALHGTAAIHHADDIAVEQWSRCSRINHLTYLGENPPGTLIASPRTSLPEVFRNRLPTAKEANTGQQNFAVIISKIKEVDLLFIRESGHVRANFERSEHGAWKQHWREP